MVQLLFCFTNYIKIALPNSPSRAGANMFIGCFIFGKKNSMAITKKQLIDTINAMPEEEYENLDVVMERMMILKKIEKAEKNIRENKTYTTEEAKQYLSSWFQ